MMRYAISFSLLLFINMFAMEERPRYTLNNRVVYFKESHESGEQPKSNSDEFETVSDFNNAIEVQKNIINEAFTPKNNDIAVINNGSSNKFKVLIALIAGGSTVSAAIISALVTYYSKKC